MSAGAPPPLGPQSVVAIRREGGLAHFPGLAAPRQIRCAECTEGQRRWLARLLDQAQRCRDDEMPAGADQRVFRLDVEEDEAPASPEARPRQVWSLTLAEERTPEALVTLWHQGRLEEE